MAIEGIGNKGTKDGGICFVRLLLLFVFMLTMPN
jgi:hypothetical protein